MLIRRKLGLSSLALIILTAVSGIMGLMLLSSVQVDLKQNNSDIIPHCTAVMRMTEALLNADAQAEELARATNAESFPSQQELASTLTSLEDAIRDGMENIKNVGLPLAQQSHDDEEIEAEKKELETLTHFQDASADLKKNVLILDSLARANSPDTDAQFESKIKPAIEHLLPEFRKYQDQIWAEMRDESLQIEKSVNQTKMLIRATTVAALALVIAMLVFISRSISKPILNLEIAVKRIGRGERDVSVDVLRKDEIGILARAFNQMTKDLRETTVSKEYVDAIIRSMGDMLVVADRDGRIRSANRELLELLGYTEDQLLEIPFESLLLDSHIIQNPEFHQTLEKGNVHRFEAEFLRKDQATVPVSISVSGLRDTRNVLDGYVWVAKDITAQKIAEARFEQVNKELMAASRQAGMAEIATSVLHNVGNVLNSVNVSGNLIAETIKNSKVANISKIVALMNEHETDIGDFFNNDPKGKKIPGYLSSLANFLDTEREMMTREIVSLVGNIVHIKQIVSTQQNYAKSFGVTEFLHISELVDDALRMNCGAMTRHQVKVVREFADTPAMIGDRHKILQILINLIRNAQFACNESGNDDKKITVRIANNEGSVKVSVADNGIGIPPENITRIFNHGFTTRKDGHGFGLHSGALTAKEMGGNLSVFSEGQGFGATFTLELPLKNQN